MKKETKEIDIRELFVNKLRELMRDTGVRLEDEATFTVESIFSDGITREFRFRIDSKSGEEIIQLDT